MERRRRYKLMPVFLITALGAAACFYRVFTISSSVDDANDHVEAEVITDAGASRVLLMQRRLRALEAAKETSEPQYYEYSSRSLPYDGGASS